MHVCVCQCDAGGGGSVGSGKKKYIAVGSETAGVTEVVGWGYVFRP